MSKINHGEAAMNAVLGSPLATKTSAEITRNGIPVKIEIKKRGAATLQLVAYGETDRHGNTEADAWAEVLYTDGNMPLARMHIDSVYDEYGRGISGGHFGEWIPTSAYKALEWVAQVAAAKRGFA